MTTHRHASGRFDRSVELLRSNTLTHMQAAPVVSGTEADRKAQGGKRRATLRDLARKYGWHLQAGNGGSNDDCWALVDTTRVKAIWGANLPVESNRGGPSTRPEAVFLVLEEDGVRWLLSVMHLPHGVGLLNKVTHLTKRWKIEAADWHRQAVALAAKHGCVGGVLCGDWNVNLRSATVRKAITKTMPGVRVWPTIPDKGTHAGGRLIDFTVTFGAMRADSATVLPVTKASDHAAYSEAITIKGGKPMPRQARSLDVMLAEVNAHAPNRSKASDGGLGDQAHASRVSDHNPNAAGVWRARDVTHDPKHGMDADDLARRIAAKLGKHPALGPGAYVIRNRRIISTNRLSEGWRPYSGANPHTKHVHISVATNASGYDSTEPWHIYQEDDDMPYNDWPKADRDALASDVAEAIRRELLTGQTGAPDGRHLGVTLSTIYNAATETRDLVRALVKGGK